MTSDRPAFSLVTNQGSNWLGISSTNGGPPAGSAISPEMVVASSLASVTCAADAALMMAAYTARRLPATPAMIGVVPTIQPAVGGDWICCVAKRQRRLMALPYGCRARECAF